MPSSRCARLVVTVLFRLMLAVPAAAAPAAAQLIGGPIVPAGHLRLDIHSSFITWDERFGLRMEGDVQTEEIEPLGWQLSSGALGSARLPAASGGEAHLGRVLEDPEYRHNLGSTNHFLAAHVRRVPLGFRLGIFPWLTVGASLPMVQRKIDSELVYLPGEANAGPVPPDTERGAFLNDYITSLSEARSVVDRMCAGDASTSECVEGLAVMERSDMLFGALSTLYEQSAYLPLEHSEAGQVLTTLLGEVQDGMTGLGVTGFTAALPLGTPLDQGAFDSLVVAPVFGLEGLPMQGSDNLWEPGDVEVTLALGILNTIRPPPPAASSSLPADSLTDDDVRMDPDTDSGGALGVQVGVAGSLRLGTGVPQDTVREFLDMDLAEGQTDIELHGFAYVNWAHRAGLAVDVRYGVTSPVPVMRRVAPPDLGFSRISVLESVEWRPGNYLDYAFSPQLLLTPQLSVGVVYRSYRQGVDSYQGSVESADSDLTSLSLETEASVQSLGVDVRYSSFRGGGFPLEIRFGWETARSGSGGRTPKTARMTFGASLLSRIWGSDRS